MYVFAEARSKHRGSPCGPMPHPAKLVKEPGKMSLAKERVCQKKNLPKVTKHEKSSNDFLPTSFCSTLQARILACSHPLSDLCREVLRKKL